MAYFYQHGENAALGAAAEGALGAQFTVPAGSRAMVRRVEGYTLEATDTYVYLNQGAVGTHLFTLGRTGPGDMSGETFITVDAVAAAVTLLLSGWQTAGGTACGGQFSGTYNP